MNQGGYTIRLETPDDYRAAENLTREAFWNVYRPGCIEHYPIDENGWHIDVRVGRHLSTFLQCVEIGRAHV